MSAVLLATCAALPDGDEDATQLVGALAAAGVAARSAVWNDPAVDWSDALVVIRSTWDYTADRAAFLRWAASVPRVTNPATVLSWNTDKSYLRDLAAAGVPSVPSAFVAPGERATLAHAPVVIKPSIGAGSRGVGRFGAGQSAAAHTHVARLHAAGRTALIQPYLDAVEAEGETALVYFNGVFSHAIRKAAMLSTDTARAGSARPPLPEHTARPLESRELYVTERITAREPSAAEHAVGAAALAAVRDRFGADQLYARVDLLPSPDGPVLVELELTEPSLFLRHGAGATDAFAAAIAARAGRQ